MTTEVECVWDLKATLGEGPLWSAAERALWFVDIKSDRIHRYAAATGETKSFATPPHPGFIVADGQGGFIIGLQAGLHRFDPAAGAFALLHEVEPHLPANRLNDGAIDPSGRLWFGSMDNGERAKTGSLYRLDADGPKAVDGGIAITNGPCFSPDGKILYHTETRTRTIYAFDVADDGGLSGKRAWITIEDGAGHPDGSVTDGEGCVWVALYGGWAARRYAPDGRLISTQAFPCANITKLAFGGPDLKTVYATTAHWGLSAASRAEQPLAGGLFCFQSDVAGLA